MNENMISVVIILAVIIMYLYLSKTITNEKFVPITMSNWNDGYNKCLGARCATRTINSCEFDDNCCKWKNNDNGISMCVSNMSSLCDVCNVRCDPE